MYVKIDLIALRSFYSEIATLIRQKETNEGIMLPLEGNKLTTLNTFVTENGDFFFFLNFSNEHSVEQDSIVRNEQ